MQLFAFQQRYGREIAVAARRSESENEVEFSADRPLSDATLHKCAVILQRPFHFGVGLETAVHIPSGCDVYFFDADIAGAWIAGSDLARLIAGLLAEIPREARLVLRLHEGDLLHPILAMSFKDAVASGRLIVR